MPSTSDEFEKKKRTFAALWVFAMFNYLYADVIGLMDSTVLPLYLQGHVGDLTISPGFLFGAAVLMEIPIAMTLLSTILKPRANRLANLVAGTVKTIAVACTLFLGTPTAYYVFFATIEILCTAFIVVSAWRWRPAPQ